MTVLPVLRATYSRIFKKVFNPKSYIDPDCVIASDLPNFLYFYWSVIKVQFSQPTFKSAKVAHIVRKNPS